MDHHDHGHDGHDHDHDHHGHDHSDEVQPALQTLLRDQIEFARIVTLNESEPDAGRRVIEKTWTQRLDPEPRLSSDADEQLLIHVPFAGTVQLHSILLRTAVDATAPRTLKLFCNREDLDFAAVEHLAPAQTLELSQASEVQETPVQRARFNNVYSLTLFIESNHGAETTGLSFLAFKGTFTRLLREPVEVLYERAANPRDHAPIVGVEAVGSNTRTGM